MAHTHGFGKGVWSNSPNHRRMGSKGEDQKEIRDGGESAGYTGERGRSEGAGGQGRGAGKAKGEIALHLALIFFEIQAGPEVSTEAMRPNSGRSPFILH